MSRGDAGHLPRWQRRWLYGVGAALLVTGLLWLAFHFGLRIESPYGPRPHWLEYQWLRLHGLVALFALVTVGSLVPTHIRRGWEVRRTRRTGLAALIVLAILALTGYALQYFSTEATQGVLSVLHWGLGLGLMPVLVWHVVGARRGRLRAPRPRSTKVPDRPMTKPLTEQGT